MINKPKASTNPNPSTGPIYSSTNDPVNTTGSDHNLTNTTQGKTLGSEKKQPWFSSDSPSTPKQTLMQKIQKSADNYWNKLYRRLQTEWQWFKDRLLAKDRAIAQTIRQKILLWFFVSVPKYILES